MPMNYWTAPPEPSLELALATALALRALLTFYRDGRDVPPDAALILLTGLDEALAPWSSLLLAAKPGSAA